MEIETIFFVSIRFCIDTKRYVVSISSMKGLNLAIHRSEESAIVGTHENDVENLVSQMKKQKKSN